MPALPGNTTGSFTSPKYDREYSVTYSLVNKSGVTATVNLYIHISYDVSVLSFNREMNPGDEWVSDSAFILPVGAYIKLITNASLDFCFNLI